MRLQLMFAGFVCVSVVAGAEEVSLSKNLLPLFERSCAVCHKRDGGKEKAIENGAFYENERRYSI